VAELWYICSHPGKHKINPGKEINVASFCWKCGAELSPDKPSCPICGAAVTGATPAAAPAQPAGGYTPVAPVQPAAFTPVSQPSPGYSQVPPAQPSGFAPASQPGGYTPAPQPGGYTPAPPPPPGAIPPAGLAPATGGGGALKIILIVVAIIVGLGILGVGAIGFTMWRVAHAFHAASHGGEATFNTPGGSFTANSTKSYTAEELGTDIYPGATVSRGGMRMNLPTGSMVTGIFVTSDSKDQVVEFYKSRLGSESSLMDTNDGAVLTLARGQQESVMVTVTQKPNENGGKTQIAIVHTKSNKPS